MERKLKLSTSRKTLYTLSGRQRIRVMSEVRCNLRVQNSCKRNTLAKNIIDASNMHDIPGPSIADNDHFTSVNIVNDTCDDIVTDNNESSSSSSLICHNNATVSSFFNTSLTESISFRERLASCLIDNNLTHIQGNSILALLRTHSCFSILPKDVRTFLNTPRNGIVVSTVEPDKYIHFDLETRIIEYLTHISSALVSHLEIDFNTDGCTLDRSGIINIWPIQIKIANI